MARRSTSVAVRVARPALALVLALAAAGVAPAQVEPWLVKPERLPPAARVEAAALAPPAVLARYGREYGAPVAAVANQGVVFGESRVQVNVVVVADEATQPKVFSALFGKVGRANAVLRAGPATYEVIGRDLGARAAVVAALPLSAVEATKIRGGEFPPEWTPAREEAVAGATLAAVRDRLGGLPQTLLNQHFLTANGPLQVNLVGCRDAADAGRVAALLDKLGGGANAVFSRGAVACEIITPNGVERRTAARLVKGEWGAAKYEVSFTVVPLAAGNAPGEMNVLFNQFLGLAGDGADAARAALAKALPTVKTADSLRLNVAARATFAAEYAFDPSPAESAAAPDGVLTARFGALPRLEGYPVATVRARLTVRDRTPAALVAAEPLTPQQAAALTAPTPAWPCDNAAFADLAKRIAEGQRSALGKARAIHQWVFQNVKYAGDNPGSRQGAARALESRQGRCWDKCDLYVTLARAAGLPSRQLAGWVDGLAGHVWAESHIDAIGWLPIDATSADVGVSNRYLPWFATDTGDMAFLYTRVPEIKWVE